MCCLVVAAVAVISRERAPVRCTLSSVTPLCSQAVVLCMHTAHTTALTLSHFLHEKHSLRMSACGLPANAAAAERERRRGSESSGRTFPLAPLSTTELEVRQRVDTYNSSVEH